MRSLVQSRQLDEEDAVEGLKAANTFFGDGKGVKKQRQRAPIVVTFPRALS